MQAVGDEQDRQIQLMKADNDVEAALLMHTLSCSKDESRPDDGSISAPSRRENYAWGCRRQHEL
ncbi:hypothetical protein X801_07836 [Opisthorchis viverrini]|uniref:Uncharacterized protein n=1 Tax=Opisthorchis viverrini TaxID=6198 RepID=A0A1S8WPN3_OPIVI|nr:hypothetical protein X801_07836 [Opisthorchis viverrini]